jgi:hypothetical protein
MHSLTLRASGFGFALASNTIRTFVVVAEDFTTGLSAWHIKHTTSGPFPWDPLDDSFLKPLGCDIPVFCFQTEVLIEFVCDRTQAFLALYLICFCKLGTRYLT